MPTGAKNGKSQFTAARLPLDLHEAAQRAAMEQGVSLSQLIIAALREYLQKEDAKG